MKRRKFLKYSVLSSAVTIFLPGEFKLFAKSSSSPAAVWVEGGEPAQLIHSALEAYGGMTRFISKGDIVVVKPNIGWDRAPQFAADTNPELVTEVIKACYEAGAKKVKVFDRTCNNPRRCYRNSQIEKAAKSAGAEVFHVREHKFKKISLPEGELLKEWAIYQDYLEADKVINIPIAKHHSLARVTLGLKNLMGVMGGERGQIHNHFEKKLIDITSHILPTLTIIDAYRILVRNGPVGGNLNDVKLTKTLIMSPCTVTADFLALKLFGHKLEEIGYLKNAYERKMNKYNPDQLDLKIIKLA